MRANEDPALTFSSCPSLSPSWVFALKKNYSGTFRGWESWRMGKTTLTSSSLDYVLRKSIHCVKKDRIKHVINNSKLAIKRGHSWHSTPCKRRLPSWFSFSTTRSPVVNNVFTCHTIWGFPFMINLMHDPPDCGIVRAYSVLCMSFSRHGILLQSFPAYNIRFLF